MAILVQMLPQIKESGLSNSQQAASELEKINFGVGKTRVRSIL